MPSNTATTTTSLPGALNIAGERSHIFGSDIISFNRKEKERTPPRGQAKSETGETINNSHEELRLANGIARRLR